MSAVWLIEYTLVGKDSARVGLNCVNFPVELVTVKTDRIRCCCGSEERFTDGESALYCAYSFKNKQNCVGRNV